MKPSSSLEGSTARSRRWRLEAVLRGRRRRSRGRPQRSNADSGRSRSRGPVYDPKGKTLRHHVDLEARRGRKWKVIFDKERVSIARNPEGHERCVTTRLHDRRTKDRQDWASSGDTVRSSRTRTIGGSLQTSWRQLSLFSSCAKKPREKRRLRLEHADELGAKR